MIVADTHALIWWVNDPRSLSPTAREMMDTTEFIGVSALTCWEIAYLAHRRRITLDVPVSDWLRNIFHLGKVSFLPLTLEVAVTAGELPDSVRDPVDRIIVATALIQGVPLVTTDGRIAASGHRPHDLVIRRSMGHDHVPPGHGDVPRRTRLRPVRRVETLAIPDVPRVIRCRRPRSIRPSPRCARGGAGESRD